ncbi:MAG: hypothetical protein ACLRFE_00345 [Clostridia bacterium]
MKGKFLFVIALLSVLTITGCKEEEKKMSVLSAPQEVTVQSDGDKSLIIFDEVSNAEYYDIYINDVCVTVKANGTGSIQFDASKIITLPQKYTIKVKAGSSSHFDSEFTEEYEYNHTQDLETPIITLDGTTLNWDKIPNAEFYEISITTFNPTSETIHRFTTNKFDFSNMLTNKGKYQFKVKAVSESGEYISSIYSNQIVYTHALTLQTPTDLKVEYDAYNSEMMLSFITSASVTNFTININNINYTLPQADMNRYFYQEDYENLYVLKLSSFARAKGVAIDNSSVLNVKVKANSESDYLSSSDFSQSIVCQYVNMLATPTISVIPNGDVCQINIEATQAKYLSGFAIYLNELKYKTIDKSISQIELPKEVVENAGIRIQSISNNNNCYSSNLSEVKYFDNSLESLTNPNVSFEDGVLNWTSIENATKYYVEISNEIYRYSNVIDETSIDLSSICLPNKYKAKVIAMAEGKKQGETIVNIDHTYTLKTPTNISTSTIGDKTYLNFDQNDKNAYGYVMYLNNNKIQRLFTSMPIDLTPYINEAKSYKVKVEAINLLNNSILNSPFTEETTIESVKTLSAPKLSFSKDNKTNKYYLHVDVDEREASASIGYQIWINYQQMGEPREFKDEQIDVTSYFINAGQYNFMVKALAIDSPYIKDSNMASETYTCTKQLDIVTDIKVTKLVEESKYFLTFKEQTLAAKYLVQILKEGDNNYKVEFELSHSGAEITSYVVENGVYRVYVKALALKGGLYSDSPSSGNPYKVIKGFTLPVVQNIEVIKLTGVDSRGAVNLTWDKVDNSLGYQVYIYYKNYYKEEILKKSVFVPQADSPTLNIGAGEYLCLNAEGDYDIRINAIGDGEIYENSQIVSKPYWYEMTNKEDFERNKVFMYGNQYSHKVTNIQDFKNLLWYYYLYNDQVRQYNSLEYNLKIYCDLTDDQLYTMAKDISDSFAEQIKDNSKLDKINKIAQMLLSQYPEISNYTLGLKSGLNNTIQPFCLNEEGNVYIFRYVDKLDSSKTNTIETTNQLFKDKFDLVDAFDQRNEMFIFPIDNQESVDVTTTEQLFMALQYNKRPNFVGDCDVAKIVYENARFVLREICSGEMSEYDKTLKIFDFLTKRIIWNNVTTGAFDENVNAGGQETLRANLKDYYLEGILYNTAQDSNGIYTNINQFVGVTADSEGLSKIFVVLCAIEGIDAVKVNGNNADGKNHSWNKVYIDTDSNDGVNSKAWYVVDVTSAIKYSIEFGNNVNTTTYQAVLHKYFLITDTQLGLQANSLHKRLGGRDADYKADTTFDYYDYQKYSFEFGENVNVSATFKANNEQDVINALAYAMLSANRQHRITIDIDAGTYINGATGGGSVDGIISSIVNGQIYTSASTLLGRQHNCNVSTSIINSRYIVIAVQGQNYTE